MKTNTIISRLIPFTELLTLLLDKYEEQNAIYDGLCANVYYYGKQWCAHSYRRCAHSYRECETCIELLREYQSKRTSDKAYTDHFWWPAEEVEPRKELLSEVLNKIEEYVSKR